MTQSIKVVHNVEMGHRLSLQPDSKCFHLHGHSWWITLELFGQPDETGMIINFADVKKPWREYLDTYFDHHLCLNEDDPLVEMIYRHGRQMIRDVGQELIDAWGIITIDRDPTVENMATLWGEHAVRVFVEPYHNVTGVHIEVQEAAVNKATWRYDVEHY